MSLNQLRDRVGKVNGDNGFHEVPFNLGEKLMLVNTELAECMEADRIGNYSDLEGFTTRLKELDDSINTSILSEEEVKERKTEHFKTVFKHFVKEGIEAEVVDALIRIFDLSYLMKIDLDTLFELILRNNSLRGYKHGKKY